jgi:hypothetical protein
VSKKRRRYPWTVLGIDPTHEEREIKKAYAAKLKATRPEDDAEAFQNLVRARDEAISQARYRAFGDEPEPETEERDEAASQQHLASIEAEPDAQHDDDFDAGDDGDEEDLDDPDEAPWGQIFTVLWACLRELNNRPDFKTVENALGGISQLSLEQRQALETELIEHLAEHIAFIRDASLSGSAIGNQQRWVLTALDEEFGWAQNDQRLASLIYVDKEEFVDDLRSVIEGKYPRRADTVAVHPRAWWQSGWVWFALFWAIVQIARAVSNQTPGQ